MRNFWIGKLGNNPMCKNSNTWFYSMHDGDYLTKLILIPYGNN